MKHSLVATNYLFSYVSAITDFSKQHRNNTLHIHQERNKNPFPYENNYNNCIYPALEEAKHLNIFL